VVTTVQNEEIWAALIGWQDLWMTSIRVNGVYLSHCSFDNGVMKNHDQK
jgi:hypothetical protein